jgi:hypothetical protein
VAAAEGGGRGDIGLATANGALSNGREAFVSGILDRPHVVDRPILLAFNPKTNKLRHIDLSKDPGKPGHRGNRGDLTINVRGHYSRAPDRLGTHDAGSHL